MTAAVTTWLLWLGGAACAVGGLLVLIRALFLDRARGRRRCPRCWYDMSAIPGLVCPECGGDAKREQRLFRTRRRWRWIPVALLLLALGGALGAVPAWRRGGWTTVVPAPILAALLSPFDNQAKTLYGSTAATPVASMSSWQRLLVAHECGRRLLLPAPPMPTFPMTAQHQREYILLAQLGAEADVALPAVRRFFNTGASTTDDRVACVQALPRIGTARSALATIGAAAADDPAEWVRFAATYELGASPDPNRIAVLAGLLDAPDPMVRRNAALHLGRAGVAARPALRHLDRSAGNDTDRRVQVDAAAAAAAIRAAK